MRRHAASLRLAVYAAHRPFIKSTRASLATWRHIFCASATYRAAATIWRCRARDTKRLTLIGQRSPRDNICLSRKQHFRPAPAIICGRTLMRILDTGIRARPSEHHCWPGHAFRRRYSFQSPPNAAFTQEYFAVAGAPPYRCKASLATMRDRRSPRDAKHCRYFAGPRSSPGHLRHYARLDTRRFLLLPLDSRCQAAYRASVDAGRHDSSHYYRLRL